MTAETRKELEAYLAEKAAKGHLHEGTLAYDEESGFVTISGRSVASGSVRKADQDVLFKGPESVTDVRSAIDYVVGTLST